MNRRSLFWLALIALSMLSTLMFAQFAGGSGTQANPWLVETAEHLNNVRNYLGFQHAGKWFRQIADIDLGVPPWNEGEGWVPIGGVQESNEFRNKYDGAGHKIIGLYINRPYKYHQALFGEFFGRVQNLELVDVNVTGDNLVGALVANAGWTAVISGCSCSGYVQGQSTVGGLVGAIGLSQIDNCHSSATVTGVNFTGGLLGAATAGEIHNCHSSGVVTGELETGGFIGFCWEDTIISHCYSSATVTGESYTGGFGGSVAGPISSCYSTGTVYGQRTTGGFTGSNLVSHYNCFSTGTVYGIEFTGGFTGVNSAQTSKCYSQGDVWGEENTGGFAGGNWSTITNCYSTASVHGFDNTGGFAGGNWSTITNCYSAASVHGFDNTGGLVGKNQPNNTQILSCYWDMEASGQSSSDGGQGRLTAQMVFPHSDDSYVGWDWEIWAPDAEHSINGGYPYLRAHLEVVWVDESVPPISENIISVFPQPAFKAPRVSIKSESPGKLSYTIYNVRGQKLYSAEIYSHEKEQSFELPLEAWKQLSNGVYLLSLERENQRIATTRMVVVK